MLRLKNYHFDWLVVIISVLAMLIAPIFGYRLMVPSESADMSVKSAASPPDVKGDMVLIYSNKCGHCTAMKGEWSKLEDMLPNNTLKFEDLENSDVIESMGGASYFPMIRYYPTGFDEKTTDFIDYKGDRNAASFLNFMTSNSHP